MTSRIAVIGGAYGESCAFPRRLIYRGSGFRAAATLAGLGSSVTLHTAVGPKHGQIFKELAHQLQFRIAAQPRKQDIWFRYQHPLARPEIFPSNYQKVQFQEIQTESALVFGMIEGRYPVDAGDVVYDPQDGSRALPFTSDGSKASRLAMVVSYSEGVALTGKSEPSQIARSLLDFKSVHTVVVKCGPIGALVATKARSAWIRAFTTAHVYKIGSGDVFSATFAHSLLTEGRNPFESAWFASRVTAAYVETEKDQHKSSDVLVWRQEAQAASARYRRSRKRKIPRKQIYLAGPFFSTAQQWLVDECRSALSDMGFKVFSPIHDVGSGEDSFVAESDLRALRKSAVVLAILDGQDVGTVFEIGYAKALRIPVVVVAEDLMGSSLTMITGTGCDVTSDLCSALYKVCWLVMGDV